MTLRELLDSLDEHDLLSVATVRRLLTTGEETGRWEEVREAAKSRGRKPSTLRSACRRWATMDNPPVRIRKKGEGKRSDWLVWGPDMDAYWGPPVAERPALRVVAGGDDGMGDDEAGEIARRLLAEGQAS